MLERLFELASRVPAWLRPTYQGAIFILRMALGWQGKLFVAAVLAALMLLVGPERGVVLLGALTGVAMLSGAVAGTLHGILQPVQRWGGPLGTWLQWAVALLGFIMTFAGLVPDGPFSLHEPTFYPLAAGLAAAGAMAMVWLDDRSVHRPTPREFHLQQQRQQLRTTAAYRRALHHLQRGTVRP